MDVERLRNDARAIWDAGVAAVNPDKLVKDAVRVEGRRLVVGPRRFEIDRIGRIAVVGCGKAGAAMSHALEEALGQELMAAKNLVGWVNVPADCAGELSRITLHGGRPAGQNSPTEEGVRGTEEMLRIVGALGPSDVAICLISGGGSALMPAPVDGIPLRDKQAVTDLLSRHGATINELNAVRKHISKVKGGRLACACKAGALVSLIISDVVGSPLDVIASGPTAPDQTTFADAVAVFEKLKICDKAPSSVLNHLQHGANGELPETPNVLPDSVTNIIVGDNAIALAAAEAKARSLGYTVLNLGGYIEGETKDAAVVHVSIARSVQRDGKPFPPPVCILSGGETTVSDVATGGKGGRNQEFVLAALAGLQHRGMDGMLVLSGGTDGEDGPTDAAGAFADANVLAAARKRNLNPQHYLASSRSYDFFDQAAALIKTGPTQTNVMDLRVLLVYPSAP